MHFRLKTKTKSKIAAKINTGLRESLQGQMFMAVPPSLRGCSACKKVCFGECVCVRVCLFSSVSIACSVGLLFLFQISQPIGNRNSSPTDQAIETEENKQVL